MRVFLIAGEASGDALGAALMAGLKQIAGDDLTFDGIGGGGMAEEGLNSLFPMEDLSVMGIAEVLPRYAHLRRRLHQTADHVIDTKPDLVVTIDSPDFCLRVLRRVRAKAPAIRTVHYVAPTVWAWRPKRAEKMAGLVDQVLTLYPFEPPYMEAHGIRADFVGHPVAVAPQASAEDIAAFRAAEGVGDAPMLLVLPGSRMGEITRHAPIFREAVGQALTVMPDLRPVIPVAPGVADALVPMLADWPGAPVVLDPRGQGHMDAGKRKRAAFAGAEIALAASGTVSLELAAADTPMVIAYKGSWLSHAIIERMLLIDTVTMVNLVSDTRTVPEYLGKDCRPGPIAAGLETLRADPGAQRDALRITMERLGRGGEDPGLRAARAVLDGLGG